jgi:hypothetical protein
MTNTMPTNSRRHDLDALRASAMLLGIVYHVALSFALGFGWMVQDVSQSRGPFVFQAFVHGFRMPLFMLVSGFFTAMLWHRRGLKALLWHRFRRVLLPCLLGLITVVPAMIWSSHYAIQSGMAKRQKAILAEPASANLWAAIRKGDLAAFKAHLNIGADLKSLHPEYGITPLTWAALTEQKEMVTALLERGVEVNGRNRDGGTALHAAAFLGRADIVELLIRRGADVNASNFTGEVPLRSAGVDWGIVQYIAGLLAIPVEKVTVEQGRERVLKVLKESGAHPSIAAPAPAPGGGGPTQPNPLKATFGWLMNTPVFILIWFLWILWWLVVVFAGIVALAQRLHWQPLPSWLILSPANLAILVPLTMIPIGYMGWGNGEFGPDISMGIIPLPRVFAYYALFFFFGVLYYDCDDTTGHLGRSWRWTLPVALLVVFPVGLEFSTGVFGLRHSWLPAQYHHFISVVVQALYTWMMCFGCMGLFRSLLVRENPTIRYLSDSSYWLYLAHLPLTIYLQTLIKHWPLPGLLKLTLLCLVVTGFLLLTYDKLIRYTWVGTMLNGPRKRPEKAVTLPATPERSTS